MAYRATKSGILFGRGFVLATLIAVPFLPHGAAMALLPVCAVISGILLGPKQGRPLPELVEENPQLWRIVAVIWLAAAGAMLYMAFFHRIAINFLLDTSIGLLILLALLLGPFVPSIFTHERERYRNAPRY
jgi:hypothetical protein